MNTIDKSLIVKSPNTTTDPEIQFQLSNGTSRCGIKGVSTGIKLTGGSSISLTDSTSITGDESNGRIRFNGNLQLGSSGPTISNSSSNNIVISRPLCIGSTTKPKLYWDNNSSKNLVVNSSIKLEADNAAFCIGDIQYGKDLNYAAISLGQDDNRLILYTDYEEQGVCDSSHAIIQIYDDAWSDLSTIALPDTQEIILNGACDTGTGTRIMDEYGDITICSFDILTPYIAIGSHNADNDEENYINFQFVPPVVDEEGSRIVIDSAIWLTDYSTIKIYNSDSNYNGYTYLRILNESGTGGIILDPNNNQTIIGGDGDEIKLISERGIEIIADDINYSAKLLPEQSLCGDVPVIGTDAAGFTFNKGLEEENKYCAVFNDQDENMLLLLSTYVFIGYFDVDNENYIGTRLSCDMDDRLTIHGSLQIGYEGPIISNSGTTTILSNDLKVGGSSGFILSKDSSGNGVFTGGIRLGGSSGGILYFDSTNSRFTTNQPLQIEGAPVMYNNQGILVVAGPVQLGSVDGPQISEADERGTNHELVVNKGIIVDGAVRFNSGTGPKIYADSSNNVLINYPVIVSGSVTATNFINSSDRRLKENIEEITTDESKELIDEVKVYSFNLKNESDENEPKRKHYGVIAQELQEIAPELVHEDKTENHYLSVNYTEIIPHLINVVKDQKKTINDLTERIEKLESIINELIKK